MSLDIVLDFNFCFHPDLKRKGALILKPSRNATGQALAPLSRACPVRRGGSGESHISCTAELFL